MKIVFLSGFAGAGKDTVAELLCQHKGYTRFAFADPVKEAVANNLHIPLGLLHTVEGKNQIVDGISLRQHCITLAEYRRKENPEYWGNQIAEAIRASSKTAIVISDWRHLSELFAIQKAFPTAEILPIRIRRSNQYISSVPDVTEYGLLGFPFAFELQNNGVSKEDLFNQINLLPL